MKELKTTLSAAINMIKGFCFNGRLCNGWRQVDESNIEFRYADDGRIARVNLNDIESIGTYKIFDERHGFNKPYPNVITSGQ
jgi:hypothetical protein